MTLTRWERPELSFNPFGQLSMLRGEIDRLLEPPVGSLGDGSQPFERGWWPAVDLFHDKDNVIVKVELPGMKKQDIEITLQEGVLSISGERNPDEKYQEAEVHRSERFTGRFSRSITLPATVDGEKCGASYQDGILTILLPKKEEAKAKQIEVKVSGK
jgi:HSP20 family protein